MNTRGLTNEQLREAFEAMHWSGWTFEAAMHDRIRSKVVVARACLKRAREQSLRFGHTTQPVKRFNPTNDTWRTSRATGELNQQAALQ